MKRSFPLLLALALCAGCARMYNITLNDGDTISSRGRPVFDRARSGYIYTDPEGHATYISMLRVKEIEPQAWAKSDASKGGIKFLPAPGGQ
jgi:hypothetical protein